MTPYVPLAFRGGKSPRQPVVQARSMIGMSLRVRSIPAGFGSRPQLPKCLVILCSAIDRFSNLKKYHRPLILKGFLSLLSCWSQVRVLPGSPIDQLSSPAQSVLPQEGELSPFSLSQARGALQMCHPCLGPLKWVSVSGPFHSNNAGLLLKCAHLGFAMVGIHSRRFTVLSRWGQPVSLAVSQLIIRRRRVEA